MADGALAEVVVDGGGDERRVEIAVGQGEGDEVVGLAGERGRHGARDGVDHVRDSGGAGGNVAEDRVADAVGGLLDGGELGDFKGGEQGGFGGRHHASF